MCVKFYVDSWSLPTIHPVSELFTLFVSVIFGNVTDKINPSKNITA